MGEKDSQINWDLVAEKFDMWLPQLKPVGDALLDALNIQKGDRVIDIASGTGEPAITLSKRMNGSVKIIGIDAADGMVRAAQRKVIKESLMNISFQCMPAERLIFDNESFNRAVCRFGVMLFNDPLQGLKEMHRVLKGNGSFAIAVWSAPETMPVMYWSYEVFKKRLPKEKHPPLAKITSLGAPGILKGLLADAGFKRFSIERKSFNYQFDSFDEYWDIAEASDILKQQFDSLPESERGKIRDEVRYFARDFVHSGGLTIPHEYLLANGIK
jgi:ubiquinone/menaquinone biosynthesis C-methylase UbiE